MYIYVYRAGNKNQKVICDFSIRTEKLRISLNRFAIFR